MTKRRSAHGPNHGPEQQPTSAAGHGPPSNQAYYWTAAGWVPAPRIEQEKSSGLRMVAATAVITGLIGAVFYVVLHSGLGASTCASRFTEKASNVFAFFCAQESQRVTTAHAGDYVDSLFAKANGTQRQRFVWDLMVHDDVTRGDVTADWRTLLRIERLEEVTRTNGRNSFMVPVRVYVVPEEALSSATFYTATLNVYVRHLTLTLRHTEAGVRASALTFDSNDPAGRVTPRPQTSTVRSDFYDQPARVPDESENVLPGSVIYEVCQLEMTGSEVWWGWTYLGWVPHADLASGDVELDGVPRCVYQAPP